MVVRELEAVACASCSAITISSSDALPARSPMPLTVHLDLTRAALHAGQAVGHREAQVVVAVHRDGTRSMPRARSGG
jgi:hypothetical protein